MAIAACGELNEDLLIEIVQIDRESLPRYLITLSPGGQVRWYFDGHEVQVPSRLHLIDSCKAVNSSVAKIIVDAIREWICINISLGLHFN